MNFNIILHYVHYNSRDANNESSDVFDIIKSGRS